MPDGALTFVAGCEQRIGKRSRALREIKDRAQPVLRERHLLLCDLFGASLETFEALFSDFRNGAAREKILPNVKDEPRQWLARGVRQHDS